MLIRITVAVQDIPLRGQLQKLLARPDILVQVPAVRKGLWDWIIREPSDVVIVSQDLLPKSLSAKFNAWIKAPDSPAWVVLSDRTDPVNQAHLLAEGYDAVLHTSLAAGKLRAVIEPIILKRRRTLQKFCFATRPLAAPCLADFVSCSSGMADFMKLVPRVVRNDTTLLIEGETGVGKERLASAIHSEGPRAAERFVALNCGALPEHLLESELFGHVRGAFTGATNAHRGWFETAHHGTLFLDEVAEIPLHLQVKLLRVLQEREIQPVGGEKSISVDVRVIAASNRPLEAEIEAGRFRRDLYHRLSVMTVTLPPLRNRVEDIPALVQRLIAFKSKELRREVAGIGIEALKALCRYPWPGNVRELDNVIERAILLCDNNDIGVENLPDTISRLAADLQEHPALGQQWDQSVSVGRPTSILPIGSLVRLPEYWLARPLHEVRTQFFLDLERQYVKGRLIAAHGRVGEAAKGAGMPERSLYEKMQLFNLHKEDFRQSCNGKQVGPIASQSAESPTRELHGQVD